MSTAMYLPFAGAALIACGLLADAIVRIVRLGRADRDDAA